MTGDHDRLDTAWRLLTDLGVSLADLRDDLRVRLAMPTVGEYLPRVAAATDVEALRFQVAATALSRRNTRGGRHASEHVIAAARAVYVRAIADGLLQPGRARPTRWPSYAGCPTPAGR